MLSVDLKLIERVERSKGMDYYDFCIDLCFSDKTIKMRPIDRGDMQAWLGVLQTQLASKRENTDKGSVITMLHQGWIEKRSERGKGSDAWKKRYFVLCTKQEKEGDGTFQPEFVRYERRTFKGERAPLPDLLKTVVEATEAAIANVNAGGQEA